MCLWIANFKDETSRRLEALPQPEAIVQQLVHDLRSPMSAIYSSLHVLKKSSPDHLKEAIDLLEISTQQLSDCLEQSSNSSKSDFCGLPEILIDALKEARALYPQIDFEIAFDEIHEKHQIRAEQSQVRRILSNLIKNSSEAAAKKICIAATFQKSDSQALASEALTLKISDDGCGIPVHQLPFIGKRQFSFGDSAQPRGTGLGLSHAKERMNAWGGKLEIQSQPEQGTTVSLSFRTKPESLFGKP